MIDTDSSSTYCKAGWERRSVGLNRSWQPLWTLLIFEERSTGAKFWRVWALSIQQKFDAPSSKFNGTRNVSVKVNENSDTRVVHCLLPEIKKLRKFFHGRSFSILVLFGSCFETDHLTVLEPVHWDHQNFPQLKVWTLLDGKGPLEQIFNKW